MLKDGLLHPFFFDYMLYVVYDKFLTIKFNKHERYPSLNQYINMIMEILKNLEKNNKLPIVKQEGQWILGTKKIIIMYSEPIDKYIDGSLNGLKLQGIGKYTISFEESSCIYVFTFFNDSRIQHEYVIIPQPELLKRLHSQNHIERCNNIRFWLTKNSKLIESYGYGAEGEFMALWLNKNRDFTQFLNNWTVKE